MIHKTIHLCAVVMLCCIAVACSDVKSDAKSNAKELKSRVSIEGYLQVNDFPSASGVEYHNGAMYVVGDDSYDLRKYTDDWTLSESLTLLENPGNNKRIPKASKPDYESLCWMNPQKNIMMVLPSGSDSPTRDSCLVINVELGRTLAKKSLAPLYKRIWEKIGTPGNKINIEGVVNVGEHIYMLHRGNLNENILVRIEIGALIQYLRGFDEGLATDIVATSFKLPEINGFKAGMSGATFVKEHNAIVFTASVEGTTSVIDDGEILGSFIGWIDLNETGPTLKFCEPVIKDGTYFKTKMEGVAVTGMDEQHLKLITVSDDDKGSSELFRMSLKL